MQLPIPALLGLFYALSEAGLGYLKRSRDDSVDADRHSLRMLWIVIVISVSAATLASFQLAWANVGGGLPLLCVATAVFVAGLALRWYAIVYLGRFFTVNVAIHSRHEIIDTGPYARIRHPSYAGALLAFFGLALSLDNWVAMLLIVLPVTMAFRRRIRIEERALSSALGRPYITYMQRTKRLVPGVY
ncbi:MAG TPA: isoprenylcysteine carboxylmethyltransferase family protein [Steroidobacteraceae bacterium]|nr:isoprenylcysteine carboxylmethyltransferase family protein [Steroidobacteraceae bacterium]